MTDSHLVSDRDLEVLLGQQQAEELFALRTQERPTLRAVNPGAEQWLGQVQLVLNHGLVRLVDYMGDDSAVIQAARISYGSGTTHQSSDRSLIRYLMRHRHTTPLEMCELKLHMKLPIFVARQLVRHRAASINEISARYSVLDREFYTPQVEHLGGQSKSNKQGRIKNVPAKYAETVQRLLIQDSLQQYDRYQSLLNDDGCGKPVDASKPMIARELARIGLGLSFYTQWYWKIDLHNLLHCLALRADPHAQWEIQQYAEAILRIVKTAFPFVYEAFEDYHPLRKGYCASGMEVDLIKSVLGTANIQQLTTLAQSKGMTDREIREFLAKFDLG